MKRRHFCLLSVLAPLGMAAAPAGAVATAVAPEPDGRPHAFGFAQGQFALDGQPWQIRSGEMHPLRIPREYWLHRIRMAKAMGLNTIALYLMWNALEAEPGVFDLDTDRRDFVAFIRLCAQEGMWVYLRPGPYVCAEWTLGGLPAYLLREPGMRLRDAGDTRYMAAVRRYIAAVAPRIAPLLASAGGPVLMLQIENEYSMFGDDVGYLQALRRLWQEHGIDGPFAVADGMKDLRRRKAYLPGAVLGLDGADLADLQHGRAFAGDAPVWVAEGYPGWLTHWGEADFARRDYLPTLRRLLAHGHSFNLYVVHGGSNFGLSAGANADDDGSNFQPALTSYDYAAPIDERGAATPAYFALRAAIAAHLPQRLPQPPAAPPRTTFAPTLALPYASLWDNLPAAPVATVAPAGNELLFGQDQGLVLYRRRGAGRQRAAVRPGPGSGAVSPPHRPRRAVARGRRARLRGGAGGWRGSGPRVAGAAPRVAVLAAVDAAAGAAGGARAGDPGRQLRPCELRSGAGRCQGPGRRGATAGRAAAALAGVSDRAGRCLDPDAAAAARADVAAGAVVPCADRGRDARRRLPGHARVGQGLSVGQRPVARPLLAHRAAAMPVLPAVVAAARPQRGAGAGSAPHPRRGDPLCERIASKRTSLHRVRPDRPQPIHCVAPATSESACC